MKAIYYVEINLTCIVLMLLLNRQFSGQHKDFSTKRNIFKWLLRSAVALCTADMVAGICRGQTFAGARVIIQASNLVFFEMLVIIGFLWLLYVELSLGRLTLASRNKIWLLAIPLLLFTVLALSNPFTHIFFTIDNANYYTRGAGIYYHWAVSWLYLLASTVETAAAMAREKSKPRRKELAPLLYFIVAPVIASVFQMLFYGVTSTQIGITISIISIFITEQNNQIATDTLTGLNNRSGLDKYIDGSIQNHGAVNLCAIMIDVNDFKQINDKFGHMTGDHALVSMANALKLACERISKKVFLCRFGGDEFLIVGRELNEADISEIKSLIGEELKRVNSADSRTPYTLSVGMGAACGECADAEDADHLIRRADESMYGDKKSHKSGNTAAGIS